MKKINKGEKYYYIIVRTVSSAYYKGIFIFLLLFLQNLNILGISVTTLHSPGICINYAITWFIIISQRVFQMTKTLKPWCLSFIVETSLLGTLTFNFYNEQEEESKFNLLFFFFFFYRQILFRLYKEVCYGNREISYLPDGKNATSFLQKITCIVSGKQQITVLIEFPTWVLLFLR